MNSNITQQNQYPNITLEQAKNAINQWSALSQYTGADLFPLITNWIRIFSPELVQPDNTIAPDLISRFFDQSLCSQIGQVSPSKTLPPGMEKYIAQIGTGDIDWGWNKIPDGNYFNILKGVNWNPIVAPIADQEILNSYTTLSFQNVVKQIADAEILVFQTSQNLKSVIDNEINISVGNAAFNAAAKTVADQEITASYPQLEFTTAVTSVVTPIINTYNGSSQFNLAVDREMEANYILDTFATAVNTAVNYTNANFASNVNSAVASSNQNFATQVNNSADATNGNFLTSVNNALTSTNPNFVTQVGNVISAPGSTSTYNAATATYLANNNLPTITPTWSNASPAGNFDAISTVNYSLSLKPQNVQVFQVTTNFIWPVGVFSIKFKIWGSGGGGGACAVYSGNVCGMGGGGGGGAYVCGHLKIAGSTPNIMLSNAQFLWNSNTVIGIGNGGTGVQGNGAAGNGTNGISSFIAVNQTQVVVAGGGLGGGGGAAYISPQSSTGGLGGLGGTGSSSNTSSYVDVTQTYSIDGIPGSLGQAGSDNPGQTSSYYLETQGGSAFSFSTQQFSTQNNRGCGGSCLYYGLGNLLSVVNTAGNTGGNGYCILEW